MSRSRKDGRRGGAHRHWLKLGLEWGSRRPPGGWVAPGRWTKWLTHRLERRAAQRAVRAALRRPGAGE